MMLKVDYSIHILYNQEKLVVEIYCDVYRSYLIWHW